MLSGYVLLGSDDDSVLPGQFHYWEIVMSKILVPVGVCFGVLLLISQLSPRSAASASPIEPFPPQCAGNDECGVPSGNDSSCVSHACSDCGVQVPNFCSVNKKVGQTVPPNTTAPYDFCSESQLLPCYALYLCTGENAGKACPDGGCESISNPTSYISGATFGWVLTETECE